jgi:hypothetical protein
VRLLVREICANALAAPLLAPPRSMKRVRAAVGDDDA